MADVEQIKKEIHEWQGDLREPLVAAFTMFVNQLCFRRSEITLPSGIAKLFSIDDERVVFWVGETLFSVQKDPDYEKNGSVYIPDWQVNDLSEVKPVNKTVVEFEKVDDSPSAH